MLIDLLRHGAALPVTEGGSDEGRTLSVPGLEQVTDVITRARDAGAKPSLILTSPYLRALETARIAAEILGYTGKIVPSRMLEPERSPFDLWDDIRGRSGEGEVLLVSHQPLLGDLASILTGESAGIGTGTIVQIDVPELAPEPAGRVRWTVRPG